MFVSQENNINETFKFSFVGKNAQEIFNSSFEAFSQGKLTLKQMDDISKLALAKMRIENYNKEDKNYVFEQEKESEEQLMTKMQNIRETIEFAEWKNSKNEKNS